MQTRCANILFCISILGICTWSSVASEALPARSHARRASHQSVAILQRNLPTTTISEPVDPAGTSTTQLISPTATSTSIDLTHGVEDTWFPSASSFITTNQMPIRIGCKNCSTVGTITFSQGDWSVLDPDDWPGVDTITDIFDVGYVQIGIEDFEAHLELQIEPSLGGQIMLPLFTIPITGVKIPNLGSCGILFEPVLVISWQLAGGIEMTYGLELKIPNVQVVVDFANPNASSVNGLNDLSVTELPFQANVSDIELSLTFALVPRISLGVHVFEDLLTADVEIGFDIPKATVIMTQLATDSVNTQCETSLGLSVTPDYQAEFQDLYQNLTHITTEVEVGAGAGFEMQALINALPLLNLSREIALAKLPVTTLPTQCLAFQSDTTSVPGFTSAALALKAVQESASAAAEQSGGGSTNGQGSESSAYGWKDVKFGARVWFQALVSTAWFMLF